MKSRHAVSLLFLCLAMANVPCFAQYNAALLSVSVTNGTPIVPRSIFQQTWTFTNNGTITWTAGSGGCTLDLTNEDCLGAMPLITNSSGTYHFPRAAINGGKNVGPNGVGSYSMEFIAPEATGSYTDYFQLNGTNWFGPLVTVQVTVSGGNTNVYDRARAVSYANNYAAYVASDGYFWTNSNYPDFGFYGIGVFTDCPIDTAGDDCAHFVSCCIGNEPHVRGAGMNIPSRTTPTYGEPSATRIVTACLINPGYAKEVSSLSQLEPGDVIGWNWYGDTSISNLSHVTLYLGNSLLAAHATSELDVGPNHYQSGTWVWHLIHIYDYPTLNSWVIGNKLVTSWGTNWNKYALYSASSVNGPWNKVNGFKIIGNMNVVSNLMGAGPAYFQLQMP